MKFDFKNKKLHDLAWLGLPDDMIAWVYDQSFNPLEQTEFEQRHPGMREMLLMRDPDYLGWTAKVLLNIDLLPVQAAVQEVLWKYPFPMVIASRGFSKSFGMAVSGLLKAMLIQGTKIVIVGAAYRQAKVIFDYMETIWHKAPIAQDIFRGRWRTRRDTDRYEFIVGDSSIVSIPLGDGCLSPYTAITYDKSINYINHPGKEVWSNGSFRKISNFLDNGIKKTIKITTKKGFDIEGTLNHKIKILENGKIIWRRLDELSLGDWTLIDRSERWHNGIDGEITDDKARCLGAMIGNGHWTNQYRLGFAGIDYELKSCLDNGTDMNFVLQKDGVHWIASGKKKTREWIDFWGLEICYGHKKRIPDRMLASSKESIKYCLQGLFDTDGHLQINTSKGGFGITIGYTTTSKELHEQIRYLLLHFGIICTSSNRWRDKKHKRVYETFITGRDVLTFYEKINFGLKRKHKLLEYGIKNKTRWVNCNYIPEAWKIADRITKKYKRQGRGKNFSRSSQKPTFDKVHMFLDRYRHIENIEQDNDFSQLSKISDKNIFYDQIDKIEFGEAHTYDIEVPDGHEYCANGFFSHNSKIRGLRANVIYADEFGSIPTHIFETVVAGFAAVSQNPIESVKESARRKKMKELDIWTIKDQSGYTVGSGNQLVLTGTVSSKHNHFHEYWKKYKAIIQSRGDITSLEGMASEEELSRGIDWKDYCIIRVPFDLVPPDFLDTKTIARAKATMNTAVFRGEYGACFYDDTDGFYRESLIRKATASEQEPIVIDGEEVWFDAKIKGDPNKQYVFGVDPAASMDNFAIVILELHENHSRVVYCWTTNEAHYKEYVKKSLTFENDYYSFCCRKIRDLMRAFPCARIAIDSQGGGAEITGRFANKDFCQAGEVPIYEIIEKDKKKETDGKKGLHVLELIQFASAKFTSESNHGMKADLENYDLLFPQFNPAILGFAAETDKLRKDIGGKREFVSYDNLEDCVLEVEELKKELSVIVVTYTATGREHWDVPQDNKSGSKKTYIRKDRYSALLMANFAARQIARAAPPPQYQLVGGVVGHIKQRNEGNESLYDGPEWFDVHSDVYKGIIRRG